MAVQVPLLCHGVTGESVLCRGKLLDPAEKLKLERLRQEEADLKVSWLRQMGEGEHFTLVSRVSMCLDVSPRFDSKSLVRYSNSSCRAELS